MARLIHTGNAIMDLVLQVPHLPASGGDVMATKSSFLPGGGFNVMAAAARQGMAVLYAGAHGTGPFANQVRSAMAAEGIVLGGPHLLEMDTGYSVVMVEPDGHPTCASSPGAEAQLTASGLAVIGHQSDDWVYVSGYSLAHQANRSALLAWLPTLDQAVRVVFDPGRLAVDGFDAAALAAVSRQTDYLTASQEAAMVLAHVDNPWVAAHRLTTKAKKGVVVRLGDRGCVVVAGHRPVHVPAWPVEVVDTSGAGDAHTGVLMASLAAGLTPVESARRANAAAALAATIEGPATCPTASQLDAFMQSHQPGPALTELPLT